MKINPFKKHYFVVAKVRTKKKNASRIEERVHNGIIPLWFFQRTDNNMLQRLTLTFAENIAAKHKDLEVKEVTVIAFNRI